MSPITRDDLNLKGTTPPAMSVIDWIALLIMIVGAVNWGLVGALDVDLVGAIFGPLSAASRVVFVLVGLAGLYGISMLFRLRRIV
ncbi:DUF378 domain-containing protein [Variovorax sp. J22R133]|uniref:DUF378 domain-containing protein n=1 Tax=Variovorax brevis TaxID=3053503 RepID=UPI002578542D|nr:DUF378 domain-containing protein [Variovorax sp. J22R133]MDM0117257.1 DUF378 domain-containing protein [Variovorax sp. J22R133]